VLRLVVGVPVKREQQCGLELGSLGDRLRKKIREAPEPVVLQPLNIFAVMSRGNRGPTLRIGMSNE
jgi:hypothetical protein